MLLLAMSGFFIKSLLNVSRVDLGIKVDNVITFRLSPQRYGYTPQRSRLFFQRLEDELRAAPGVTGGDGRRAYRCSPAATRGNDVAVQGFQAGPDTDSNSSFNTVGAGYFSAMGIPLLSGREFTDADVVGRRRS